MQAYLDKNLSECHTRNGRIALYIVRLFSNNGNSGNKSDKGEESLVKP